MDDLPPVAREYMRGLNGETIPMSFAEAERATEILKSKGLVKMKGLVVVLTSEGRVMAKQLKRNARGRME